MPNDGIMPPYILLTEKQELSIKGTTWSGLCRSISVQEPEGRVLRMDYLDSEAHFFNKATYKSQRGRERFLGTNNETRKGLSVFYFLLAGKDEQSKVIYML